MRLGMAPCVRCNASCLSSSLSSCSLPSGEVVDEPEGGVRQTHLSLRCMTDISGLVSSHDVSSLVSVLDDSLESECEWLSAGQPPGPHRTMSPQHATFTCTHLFVAMKWGSRINNLYFLFSNTYSIAWVQTITIILLEMSYLAAIPSLKGNTNIFSLEFIICYILLHISMTINCQCQRHISINCQCHISIDTVSCHCCQHGQCVTSRCTAWTIGCLCACMCMHMSASVHICACVTCICMLCPCVVFCVCE